ncbi:MAG TPA: 23S rRNA (adenine(2503)-C(2))-methyltransferase RlmN [Thermoanaerobaculia bacterium]|nr:23S rRNA (adenine(2503)-C(2))-methyltransferase RlmN [Thermoanaerobaculia bacterium]
MPTLTILAPATPATPAASAPWDRRAPERAGLPSAWALFPDQLAELGCPGAPAHAFGRLQRVLTWGRLPGAGTPDGQLFLARNTRAWLAEHTDLALPRIVERFPSEDGATKLVLELSDGHRIEAIHMPRRPDGRVTFCVSSQVGCALGCTFCATGAMGIVRNLSAGEIVGQVLALMHELGPKRGDLVTLVFMGMGEPLHNLDHVHRAIRVLCHPGGAGLSPRRITVSTAGLVSGIERLSRMIPRPQLAVSLNATTDAQRSATMPINRAFNLARLRQALADWPLEKNERFLFEYVMLAGENDTDEDADRLAAWLGDLRHRHNVNLIPMNEHARSAFREPAGERVQRFLRRLRDHGCFVSLRKSRSRDVQGACGQLISGRPSALSL